MRNYAKHEVNTSDASFALRRFFQTIVFGPTCNPNREIPGLGFITTSADTPGETAESGDCRTAADITGPALLPPPIRGFRRDYLSRPRARVHDFPSPILPARLALVRTVSSPQHTSPPPPAGHNATATAPNSSGSGPHRCIIGVTTVSAFTLQSVASASSARSSVVGRFHSRVRRVPSRRSGVTRRPSASPDPTTTPRQFSVRPSA